MRPYRTIAVLLTLASAALAGEPTVAKLERLEPGEVLLKAPAGVAGDFAVARAAPAVDFGILPGQWSGARLWSAWGDAVCASDGKFYASIGDHDAPRGHACVYAIDPKAGTMTLVVDVTRVLGLPEGRYTPGKIHAPLVDGGDGWLYFVTYRGSVGKTTAEVGYQGDWLLRYHLASGKVENLGILVPHASVPSLVYHQPSRTFYGLAVPGKTMPEPRDFFFAYSLDRRKVVFDAGPAPNLARAVLLAADGRAYYNANGVLVRYDPKTNTATPTAARIPGDGTLRAASRPDARGVAWCISKDGVLFAFDTRTETVERLTETFVAGPRYTVVCKLDPAGRYLYYVPSAHGGSRQHGSAVIQFDVKTKRRKVLAFLNDALRTARHYNLGGTFGIALSRDASQLFVCWNGAPADQKRPDFGLCSAMILHIPEGERR